MNDNRIKKIIQELEMLVPKEGSNAKFASFGEVALYAPKEAFLRLGIEFLKKPTMTQTELISHIYSQKIQIFL